jgi:hypothetical protein
MDNKPNVNISLLLCQNLDGASNCPAASTIVLVEIIRYQNLFYSSTTITGLPFGY